MEIEGALRNQDNSLSHHMRLISAREQGLSAEQIRHIGSDPDLFEAFYREQIEDLQRFVARRVGDRERAADLTAEIFIAAIESAHRFRGRATPKTWLYGIARTIIANDARKSGREQAKEERLRSSTLLSEDDAERMDARIDAAAQSRRLYRAMGNLPDAERAVLELVAIDELSVVEAAAAVGVRPVTARVRLHRARRRLRDELELADAASTRARAATTSSAIKSEEEQP